jgi:hypothetical protein
MILPVPGRCPAGTIAHHEEPARLRQLYEMVEQVKLEMEASGQVDPQTAVQAAEAAGPLEDSGLQEYMTQVHDEQA